MSEGRTCWIHEPNGEITENRGEIYDGKGMGTDCPDCVELTAFTLPELAARDVTNIVRWSEEDECFVASLMAGSFMVSAHGSTREEAWREFQTAFGLVFSARDEAKRLEGVAQGLEMAAGALCDGCRSGLPYVLNERTMQWHHECIDDYERPYRYCDAPEIRALTPASAKTAEQIRREAIQDAVNKLRQRRQSFLELMGEKAGEYEIAAIDGCIKIVRALAGEEG